MEALPEFNLVRPTSVDGLVEARSQHPDSSLLGGGTDLMVNMRRGIVTPPVLIDTTGIDELKSIKAAFDPSGIMNPGKIFD